MKKEVELSFYERLAKASLEIKVVPKESNNPHFKSKYADINAFLSEVKKPLLENGIMLMQPIAGGKVTTVLQDCYSDTKIESSLDLPQTAVKAQDMGSYITYYRRYTLQSLLALEADDDDGNDASKQPSQSVQQPAKPWLNPNTETWSKAVEALKMGTTTIENIKKKYAISKPNEEKLLSDAI